MSAPLTATRRSFRSRNRWSLGLVVAGLILAALGIMLLWTAREGAETVEPMSPDAALAMRIYRAGEWRLEPPAPVEPEGWAAYRAGERAPAAASMVTPAVVQTEGWSAYRAGERGKVGQP